MSALLRHGDIVGLTGKIRHDQGDDDRYIFVEVDGHHPDLVLDREKVTLIAPRIDVGERVRWTNSTTGVVKAADGDKLWVLSDAGQYVTWPAMEVTMVPPKVITIDGPLDLDTLQRLRDENPQELVLPEPPPAPLDGKVGSEEEAADV